MPANLTNTEKFAKAIQKFEELLPGWWWSVGMCTLGAHASCAIDGYSDKAELLNNVKSGHQFDTGFHWDSTNELPHQALENVMNQALDFLKTYKENNNDTN